MTVIAHFSDLQLSISDILLTSDAPARHGILTPSTGNTGNIGYLPVAPSRLVRKTVRVVSPFGKVHLLVAGTVSHIEKFAQNLRSVLLDPLFDGGILGDAVRAEQPGVALVELAARLTEQQGYVDFSVAGLVNNAQYARTIDGATVSMELPYFGRVVISGSGAPMLLRWLEDRAVVYAEQYSSHDLNLRRNTVQVVVPSLLLEEDTRPSLRTISNGVGGYYECLNWTQGRFEPIDRVLTAFVVVEGKANSHQLRFRRLFYHQYQGEKLYVSSLLQEVSIGTGSEIRLSSNDFELFEILPLYDSIKTGTWGKARILKQMETPASMRLTLYRKEPGGIKLKRFGITSDQLPLRLFSKGSILRIEVHAERMEAYVTKLLQHGGPVVPIT